MLAALHVLATVVIVPYVVFACGIVILGHAISRRSLWSFFDTLLAHALWIMPWGLIGFPCVMMVVAVLGVIPRFRFLGAVCLALLAGASLAVIVIGSTPSPDSSQWLFLSPCVFVLIVAVWLAIQSS